ncbi:uncharacterized protein HMPREF1541_07305 [Cyphellophora europaea CBS 101466]|uniref:G-patch domain-containing protein n=1 Tax=Cyphellophora europaea (strain CBS 101466) TaxID=1220924 RepID=W2RMG8_CYPE1|nr:uncharacterized protein HMPREF1541_07305 [Cyphellophora europaea CBS 101466]ETN37682.1 hypothetical protein HMPREF1541_07305 [Cyphellophora europaea CBS 101466]
MSSSSDEGEPFQLRDFDEDTDDERPNKRRKMTGKPLWGKGIGFVSSAAPAQIEDDQEDKEEDEDVDDERPTMGLGSGAIGGFRSAFDIGEYAGQADREESPPPMMGEQQQPAKPIGAGRSAFAPGGKMNKNSFAARMMAKQGYVEGQGLGKHGQGISTAIQAKVLQSRAGLGTGSGTPEPPRKDKRTKDKSSKPSTPGTSTPKIRAPPKKKYTVAAIESRGLHVPEAMKSVIIDATGAENKTVSSISGSGFSTPVREASPASLEQSKAAARIKLQLSAYVDAWDATKEAEERLSEEATHLSAAVVLHNEEQQKYAELITAFERVSTDDSASPRPWSEVIKRLHAIQSTYASYISDLELPTLATSTLEAPFRSALLDWEPLTDPTASDLVTSLTSLNSLLQLPKSNSPTPRKRTTPFETLLLQHWYPSIRSALQHWSIYDPLPASALLTAWGPLLPPWLTAKLLSELILPRLIDGARRFPKRADQPSLAGTSTPMDRRKGTAPDLHAWLFDWWSLISSPDLDLELFPELRSAVKAKVTAEVWPLWKPLLGSSKPRQPALPSTTTAAASRTKDHPHAAPPGGDEDDLSFKDLVEAWCAENDLLLQSTGKSDALGRLLYRLVDVAGRGKGLRVYFEEELVCDEQGEPWGLDEALAQRVRGR